MKSYQVIFNYEGLQFNEVLTCTTAQEATAIIKHFNPTAEIISIQLVG